MKLFETLLITSFGKRPYKCVRWNSEKEMWIAKRILKKAGFIFNNTQIIDTEDKKNKQKYVFPKSYIEYEKGNITFEQAKEMTNAVQKIEG